MRVVCSYCDTFLREREPLDDDFISHGMCESCRDRYAIEWFGVPFGDYLEQFDSPIIIVDDDARVSASNTKAQALLGYEPAEGELAGNALACRFARRPGGCGKQVHCKTCAIRKSVETTARTGIPLWNVPAYVLRENQRVDLVISTKKIGALVQVSVQSVFARDEARPSAPPADDYS